MIDFRNMELHIATLAVEVVQGFDQLHPEIQAEVERASCALLQAKSALTRAAWKSDALELTPDPKGL